MARKRKGQDFVDKLLHRLLQLCILYSISPLFLRVYVKVKNMSMLLSKLTMHGSG